jgi:hypothetical protein
MACQLTMESRTEAANPMAIKALASKASSMLNPRQAEVS